MLLFQTIKRQENNFIVIWAYISPCHLRHPYPPPPPAPAPPEELPLIVPPEVLHLPQFRLLVPRLVPRFPDYSRPQGLDCPPRSGERSDPPGLLLPPPRHQREEVELTGPLTVHCEHSASLLILTSGIRSVSPPVAILTSAWLLLHCGLTDLADDAVRPEDPALVIESR